MSEHEEVPASEIPDIDAELQINGAQRSPCVLLLDTSTSMKNFGRIDSLNAALKQFEQKIKTDETISQQVLLNVISFGGKVCAGDDWVSAASFKAPVLEADGMTPMGEAMTVALAAVEDIRGKLRAEGIPYTKPWIFLVSDGAPNDQGWQQAAAESRGQAEARKVVVWPIAVPPEADAAALQLFAARNMNVYAIDESDFHEFFSWLFTSLGAVSRSRSGAGDLQLRAPGPVVSVPL